MHKIALETTELLPQKTTEPHNPIIWRMDKLFLALLVDGGPKFRASQCFQAVCKRPWVTKDSHRLKSPIPVRGELRPKLNLKLPPPLQPRSSAKLQISNELPEKPEGFYSSLPLQGWKKKKMLWKHPARLLAGCWRGAGLLLQGAASPSRAPRGCGTPVLFWVLVQQQQPPCQGVFWRWVPM